MNKHEYLPDIEMYRIIIDGKRYFVSITDFMNKINLQDDIALWHCPVVADAYPYYHYFIANNAPTYQCISLGAVQIVLFFDILKHLHSMNKYNEVGQLLYHAAYRYFKKKKDTKKAYRTTVTIKL